MFFGMKVTDGVGSDGLALPCILLLWPRIAINASEGPENSAEL